MKKAKNNNKSNKENYEEICNQNFYKLFCLRESKYIYYFRNRQLFKNNNLIKNLIE